jgi:predicted RNA binding protein with dsRBD fold (UPF0201 family)
MTKTNNIEFKTSSNKLTDDWVMRITADRRIEVAEDVDMTEAAKKVLDAMQWMIDSQKRTWVGLTDEEVDFIANKHATLQGAIWAIEAKLKEKNNA